MAELFLKILPLALVSINSPLMFAVAVFLLTQKDQPFRKILAFLLGIFVVLIAATFIGYYLGIGFSFHQFKITKWEDLAIGIILILLAVRALFSKNEKDSNARQLGKNSHRSLAGWFVIGIVLNILNFDGVLAYIVEVKEIIQTDINLFEKILIDLFCLVAFTLPLSFPVVVDLIAPKAAGKMLNSMAGWFKKYSKYIIAFLFAGFGIYLVIKSIKKL